MFTDTLLAIKEAAGLSAIKQIETRSTFNESENYTKDQAFQPGGASSDGRQAWLQESGSGSPSLFGRTVDSLLIPYAKLVAGQGYRFSPELFGERFGLTAEQTSYIKAALRLKSGKALSTAGIVAGTEEV